MSKKYTALALFAVTPALVLSAYGNSCGSGAKKVGDATCQDYADAFTNYDSDIC